MENEIDLEIPQSRVDLYLSRLKRYDMWVQGQFGDDFISLIGDASNVFDRGDLFDTKTLMFMLSEGLVTLSEQKRIQEPFMWDSFKYPREVSQFYWSLTNKGRQR